MLVKKKEEEGHCFKNVDLGGCRKTRTNTQQI